MTEPQAIDVQFIDHVRQRYDTCGDWYAEGNVWRVRVSQLGDWRMAFLVALHEQIEQALCAARGISEDVVTAFDLGFEASRVDGNYDEPGDHPAAPYRKEHRFATHIERMVAKELGVNWPEYEQRIAAL